MTQGEALSSLALSILIGISTVAVSYTIVKGKLSLRAGIAVVFVVITFLVAGWMLATQRGLFAAICGSLILGIGGIVGFSAAFGLKARLRKGGSGNTDETR